MSRFFGSALHNGFVYPDIDKAMNRMVASGIGPVYVMRNVRAPARYRGERHDPLVSVAFFSTGAIQYELVSPHDQTPSAYREYLDRNPGGGLHHVAYWSQSFETSMQAAAKGGRSLQIVQEFIDDDGKAFEIYLEPVGQENPVLVQLMQPGFFASFFEDVEAVAATWDGSHPIRDAFDLLPEEMRPPAEVHG